MRRGGGCAAGPVVELTDGRQASYEVAGSGWPALMLPGGPGLGAAFTYHHAELFTDRLELSDRPAPIGSFHIAT